MPQPNVIELDPAPGQVRPMPQTQPLPPMALSFDLQAMVRSPFFWMVVGAGVAWWMLRKKH